MTITDIKNGPSLQYNDYKVVSDATRTIRIEPLTVQLQWGGAYPSTTYNGYEQTVTCKVTNPVSGFPVAPTLSGHKYKNAGTYTATATRLSDSNYTLSGSNSSVGWKITKATLTLHWTPSRDATYTYNGSTRTHTAYFTGAKGSDNPKPNPSSVSRKDEGTSEVTVSSCASSTDNNNYKFSASTGRVKITPKKIDPPSPVDHTYDGKQKKGYTGGDSSHFTISGEGYASSMGSHKWTATAMTNYTFSGGKSYSRNWKINRNYSAYCYGLTTLVYSAGQSHSAINSASYDIIDIWGDYTGSKIGDKGTWWAKPKSGYGWQEGGYGKKTFTWTMH